MGNVFTIGKTIIMVIFLTVVFLAWKSVKLDNVEAKQSSLEITQAGFNTRMNFYDKELENVRVDSRVSKEMLSDLQKRSIRIEQLLLNRK